MLYVKYSLQEIKEMVRVNRVMLNIANITSCKVSDYNITNFFSPTLIYVTFFTRSEFIYTILLKFFALPFDLCQFLYQIRIRSYSNDMDDKPNYKNK